MPPDDPFHDYSDRERYDRALAEALSVAGESKEYFARGRVQATAELLAALAGPARRVLDFGCGVGDTTPILRDLLGAERVVGTDRSAATVALARERLRDARGIEIQTNDELLRSSDSPFDLCYSNGVFHHIAPEERGAAVATIRAALVPGGRLFLWENHPGNPGTRFIMSRCAFDDDALPVWPHQARRLLRAGGFLVEQTAYRFLFPRALAFLRPLERRLLALPIGAQYVVVARR